MYNILRLIYILFIEATLQEIVDNIHGVNNKSIFNASLHFKKTLFGFHNYTTIQDANY